MPLKAGCGVDYIWLCDMDAGPEISVTNVAPVMKINTHFAWDRDQGYIDHLPYWDKIWFHLITAEETMNTEN